MVGYMLFARQLFLIGLVYAAHAGRIGRLCMMMQHDLPNISRGGIEYFSGKLIFLPADCRPRQLVGEARGRLTSPEDPGVDNIEGRA